MQADPEPLPAEVVTIPSPVLRRSTWGTKIVRFNPKTNRLLPQNLIFSLTKAPKTVVSKPAGELHLRQALKGPDAAIWQQATTKEFGRLAQGISGLVEGTNTLRFIPYGAKPKDRLASYCRAVCVIPFSSLNMQWNTD